MPIEAGRIALYLHLRHGARHEASDLQAQRTADGAIIDRPHHRPAGPVRLLDHGLVRNVPPLAFDADAIVTVLSFPIDIRQRRPISVGATRALARAQAIEPTFEGRVGITAIDIVSRRFVRCQNTTSNNKDQNKRNKNHPVTPTCL